MSKPTYLQADYIDKRIEQSMKWLNCISEHDYVYNECCCDFSCCNPELFEQDSDKRLAIHIKFVDKLLARRNV